MDHAGLLSWLDNDTFYPIHDCEPCTPCLQLHQTLRWQGPLVCSLKTRFPGSTLPDIRMKFTASQIDSILQTIKENCEGPWFRDLMPFTEAPDDMEVNDSGAPGDDIVEDHLANQARIKQVMLQKKMKASTKAGRNNKEEEYEADIQRSVRTPQQSDDKTRQALKDKLCALGVRGRW